MTTPPKLSTSTNTAKAARTTTLPRLSISMNMAAVVLMTTAPVAVELPLFW